MDNYRSGNWNESGNGITRSLATLEKMYKEENKFSGQKESGNNDNFDHKLGIFEEMCFKPMSWNQPRTLPIPLCYEAQH